MNKIEGKFAAAHYKFAIILSRFNESIGEKLLEGSLDCLNRHGCNSNNIDLYRVPGAFEIPLIADKLAAKQKYDAIICLGAVIRGATPHFEYVAGNATGGIAQVALKYGLPIILGVLTTDTIEQAIERAGTKAGNKGWEAALNAIEMADLLNQIAKR